MTNQSDYQKWVELADKRPWEIGDRHDFCELSLKLASKVENLVEASQAIIDHLGVNNEGQYRALEKALKELTGEL